MKFFNWLVNRYLLAGLILASFACILCLAINLSYALFNFNPYYEHKGKNGTSWSIGTNYKEGIPITADVNSGNFADTSFEYETIKGTSGVFMSGNHHEIKLANGDSLKSVDTTIGNYTISPWFDTGHHALQKASGLSIQSFMVKVKPTSAWHRIELLFPSIFILIVLAYSFRQMAKFLQFIQLDDAFNPVNYKRLRNIGIALLLYQLIMYIFDHVFHRYHISIHFESTIANWRNPIYLSGSPEANSNIAYFVIGCIFLIVAKAFKEGNNLQQEQDLTI